MELKNENAITRHKLEQLEAKQRQLEQSRPKTLPKVKRGGLFGFRSCYYYLCGEKTKHVGR
ncbi:hypothetical protein CERZMDRAFT_89770 [Cercospora zeae-maydis SCOH1-5]|uniref:Uncharacterized protein n=1 Tax=Cercospora zeae-maydis SCOH1-5 TaxID=717836 RepID=A0A6A6FUC8_9PEZI|nr:hypothetical protein CERZMDRAFT_89770 [Cercospora zeae-maydis SCOH1-5]